MGILFRLASLVRNLFRRSSNESEMDAELNAFVQMLTEERIREGLSPRAARRAALLEVGGVEQVKEEVRAVRAGALLESVARDIRFGFRMLVKNPVHSLSVILTFGLGIGLTTAVFTVVNGLVFTGPPFERVDRVLLLVRADLEAGTHRPQVDVKDLADFRAQQTAFEDLAAFWVRPINLSAGNGPPERLLGGFLDHRVLRQLRVAPALGRSIGEADERPGAHPVILIGHRMWIDRFGGAPDVLGRTVKTDGVTRTIIGVMPEDFGFPFRQQVWMPLALDTSAAQRGQGPQVRVVGRLKEGVSRQQAQTQVTTVAERLALDYPDADRGLGARLETFTENVLGEQLSSLSLAMLGAVFGVLLIACVNVSNLLIARGSARAREVGVRVALGAGRTRVIRQLISEALVLALAGGVLGCALGMLGVRWTNAVLAVSPPPFWITFDLDRRVTLFVLGATALSGVVASLVPAIQTARTGIAGVLKADGRSTVGTRAGRFASGLVTAEVAMSCAVLVCAGLMTRSITQLRTVSLAFATEDVLTARISLPRLRYADPASRARFYEELLPQINALPSVDVAALGDGLPTWDLQMGAFEVEGRPPATPEDFPRARRGVVSARYFETFGTSALWGRTFGPQDRRASPPVVVVNASFARTFFLGKDPVGGRIRAGVSDTAAPWLTIVGVVPDMYMEGLGRTRASPAGYYVPLAQSDAGSFLAVAVRTRGAPASVTASLRRAVASIDADLPLHGVMSMSGVIEEQSMFFRFFGGLFIAFGSAALFLAAVGLYGVMSFAVSQRSHEMGIRLALGASGGSLVRLAMGRAVGQLAVGLGVGLSVAALTTPVLQFALYHVEARDPVVFGMVVGGLALVGLVAALVPAMRVTRVNPVAALGAE
jgi:putative ABC transport system permease protein